MNTMISLLPQLHFPGHIYSGERSLEYISSLEEGDLSLVIVSQTFRSHNKELFDKYFATFELFEQHGEPTLQDFSLLKQNYSSKYFTNVIAVGGGAVIDLAKLLKKEFDCNLIACPTTFSSGSEVSRYSVLIEDGLKKVYSSENSLPSTVLLSPLLLTGMSLDQVGYQSFDILAHALEALVSRAAHPLSDMLALMAIDTCFRTVVRLPEESISNNILNELQNASLLAGLAQSSVGTGLAHAFAHYLGARYHLPHTYLISRFLPDVVAFNLSKSDKYAKLNQLSTTNAETLVSDLQALYSRFDLRFEKLSLNENTEACATGIKKDICIITNPYPAKVDDISGILEKYV